MRPELPTASIGSSQAATAAVDNSAPLQPACSLFISRGKTVQTSEATSVLPDHVLGSALDQFLVAELMGVLEIQQAAHLAQGKTRAAGGGHASAGHLHGGAEQIISRAWRAKRGASAASI